jgi:hypothetical protein
MNRKHLLGLLFVLLLSACANPLAPRHPDFSGRWVIDKGNSKLQQPSISSLDNAVVVIEHREPNFHFQRTFTTGGSDNTFSYELTTDGKEGVIQVPGAELHLRLAWEGDQLVYSARIVAPNGESTDTVHYHLAQGGKVLEGEESYRGAINHDNHWVFNKQ